MKFYKPSIVVMAFSNVFVMFLSCVLVHGFSNRSFLNKRLLNTSHLNLSSFAKMRFDSPTKRAMINDSENTVNDASKPNLIFPGGGIFFYWQAGAVTYLREQKYDLTNAEFTGGSAGALTATLAATGVDFEVATESALQMAQDAGVWDRPLGLYGIWGPLIDSWLDELLPENSLEMVDQRLSILLTEFPTLKKNKISDFESKHDLIQCNMASVHLRGNVPKHGICNGEFSYQVV